MAIVSVRMDILGLLFFTAEDTEDAEETASGRVRFRQFEICNFQFSICNAVHMRLPRLQLHLSTCIVLMFVAGGLMRGNLIPRNSIMGPVESTMTQGWPLAVICTNQSEIHMGESGKILGPMLERMTQPKFKKSTLNDGRIIYSRREMDLANTPTTEYEFIPTKSRDGNFDVIQRHMGTIHTNSNIVYNVLTALAILAAVAFACEWIQRRSKSEVRGTK